MRVLNYVFIHLSIHLIGDTLGYESFRPSIAFETLELHLGHRGQILRTDCGPGDRIWSSKHAARTAKATRVWGQGGRISSVAGASYLF